MPPRAGRRREMKLTMFALLLGISATAAAADANSDARSKTVADFSPSDEINTPLPRWLRFSGEYRARFEGYTGGGFKPASTGDYMLSRLRLDLTIEPTAWLKFFMEGQDPRVFAKNPTVRGFISGQLRKKARPQSKVGPA